MSRQSVDSSWLDVAKSISKMSLCDGAKVGAVIVGADNRIVATGYNGPPSGFPHRERGCSEWCERQQNRKLVEDTCKYGLYCPSIHAEMNALIYSDVTRRKGGTMYVSSMCCEDCAKVIANSGISRVFVEAGDSDYKRDIEKISLFMFDLKVNMHINNVCEDNFDKMQLRLARIAEEKDIRRRRSLSTRKVCNE